MSRLKLARAGRLEAGFKNDVGVELNGADVCLVADDTMRSDLVEEEPQRIVSAVDGRAAFQ